ncbi:hypothetical protein H6F61_03320 [Cyanobacteria bacterium FACHB-472]|nr:hypothetical protein [Cyanobacteria bacterium FACHB-472]
MNSVAAKSSPAIQYSPQSIKRAERAMRCSPFLLPLFAAMRSTSVPLGAIVSSGVQHQYTRKPLRELAAENYLSWLIQVGILRREVDGQGITDSFRLTPLGRQLVENWEKQGGVVPAPSLSDRFYNALNRWFRLF